MIEIYSVCVSKLNLLGCMLPIKTILKVCEHIISIQGAWIYLGENYDTWDGAEGFDNLSCDMGLNDLQ